MSRSRGRDLRKPRHAVVVATQCEDAEELTDLVAVAAGLHQVLTDPMLGACERSEPRTVQDLRSGKVDRATVDSAVREAIVRAGEAHAVLVLAFLGHGQAPTGSGNLYYLASDSRQDDAVSSVDVRGLITAAVNHHGIAGVIVLLDVCHAGAGLPSAGELVGGFLEGRTRISALAAAPAQQQAFGLEFSRVLTRRLRAGFEEAGEFVPLSVCRSALVAELPEQDAAALEYDGLANVPSAEEGLWLSLNARRRRPNGTDGLGWIGIADLEAALRGHSGEAAMPPDPVALGELRDRMAQDPAFGAQRVAEVAEALLLAGEAERFLVKWAEQALTTYTVHLAMVELNRRRRPTAPPLRPPPELSDRPLLRYLLEYAALRDTSMDGQEPPTAALARCLVALADTCGLDVRDEEVHTWASEHGMGMALNDASAWYTSGRDEEASLVVSLHAARLDWPDSLSAWVRQGDACSTMEVFDCEPNRAGVERVLPEVVYWAEDQLRGGTRLQHIDLVVHAALLPEWRPEEIKVGLYRLGVHRTVELRWADRFFVPRHFRGINVVARELLAEWGQQVLTSGATEFKWVTTSDTSQIQQLCDELGNGRHRLPLGIRQRAGTLHDTVLALLPYTPVLLWPGYGHAAVEGPEPALGASWERLPKEFSLARRWSWSDAAQAADADGALHFSELARLRAAWHDSDWLDFCAEVQAHDTTPARNPR